MIILSDWRTTLSRWPPRACPSAGGNMLTLVIMLLWPAPDARTKYEVKQDIAKAPEAAEIGSASDCGSRSRHLAVSRSRHCRYRAGR
ncbi:MAG: hypothetical protein WDO70_07145 [Alphaproteobacteria bacterium]